uniref:Impact RWD domain protein n=1 Tax=Scleropages formosus TaxID=113540 RepID=A0A8C9WGC9_SCLFO
MATLAESAGDLQAQIDEIEALSSIYGDEWCVIDEASRIFCIKISGDINTSKWTICLQIILPHDYPSAAPPIYQLNGAWLRGPERVELSNSLEEIYVHLDWLASGGQAPEITHTQCCSMRGCLCWSISVLSLWHEHPEVKAASQEVLPLTCERICVHTHAVLSPEGPEARNWTEEEDGEAEEEEEAAAGDLSGGCALRLVMEQFCLETSEDEELPPIKHGEAITDRRSTFQPHLAPVVTPRQVKMVLDKLYENKKIASATHNIYAYRIFCEDKHTFLQDCEDDGETAAGGRLLHLLQILDVRNVMVVVSRWYGGILLGPDRFKHICNCARNILVQEGYTESADESSKAGGKNKKQKSKKAK